MLESRRMPIAPDASHSVAHGISSPLGATPSPEGTNFSVYSKHATAIELLLFDRVDDARAARVIRFEPALNRTYHYWHVFLPGVRAGQIYGYRVDGPSDPANGLRFDPIKVLLDPYGRGVAVPDCYDRGAAGAPGDNSATAMKSVVVDPSAYDWEGDAPLRRPSAQTIVYETHVRGFTRHPSSGVDAQARGTYAGLIEKIPYLHELGITAVELLPVFQFDAKDCPPGKVNYWGYAPVSFFAPHQAYSSRQDPLGPVDEFRDMVKALHRAGIEVILDVVFNHTAEGDERGPTLCFRGLDNTAYYILEDDRARYANYSGTGNTLNANHPIVRRMIVDSLRYWVEAMHVDGFRFDLASILARDAAGHPLLNPPVLWDIESDPALAGVKLIAEAWDAGGLYQVGSFITATAGRSGTAGSATTFALSFVASLVRWRGSRTGWWVARRSTGMRRARPSRASTSSPVTTASRSTTSCPMTRSTTRRTGRTIATAPTTTAAGTAAWRGQATIRRSSGCATGRSRTS
jgi:glycogen operon protein